MVSVSQQKVVFTQDSGIYDSLRGFSSPLRGIPMIVFLISASILALVAVTTDKRTGHQHKAAAPRIAQ